MSVLCAPMSGLLTRILNLARGQFTAYCSDSRSLYASETLALTLPSDIVEQHGSSRHAAARILKILSCSPGRAATAGGSVQGPKRKAPYQFQT